MQPKSLKLSVNRGKANYLFHFRVDERIKSLMEKAMEKLNSISPVIKFSRSDFCKLSLLNLSNCILSGEIEISLNIPNKTITFALTKSKKRRFSYV